MSTPDVPAFTSAGGAVLLVAAVLITLGVRGLWRALTREADDADRRYSAIDDELSELEREARRLRLERALNEVGCGADAVWPEKGAAPFGRGRVNQSQTRRGPLGNQYGKRTRASGDA